jgi:hypothetical protein
VQGEKFNEKECIAADFMEKTPQKRLFDGLSNYSTQ